MHSVKSLMARVFYRIIEKVAMLAGISDQLQQWYIHHHISLGTLVHYPTLSKTN